MRVLIFVMLPTLLSVPATTLAAPLDLSAWLTRQAGHKEVKRRRAAVELLGDLRDLKTTGLLLRALEDKDARVRSHAAWALYRLETATPAAISALVKHLGDSGSTAEFLDYGEPFYPRHCVEWPSGAAACEEAHMGLGSVGDIAARALQQIGRPAAPALLRALAIPKAWGQAAKILLAMKDARLRRAVIKRLVKELGRRERSRRTAAALMLRRLGPRAGEAASQLRRGLKHRDPWTRLAAARALGAVSPQHRAAATQALSRLLLLEEQREEAAGALLELGPAGIAALARAAGGKDEAQIKLAIAALSRAGKRAGSAAPVLVKLLDHKNDELGAAAAEALGKLRPGSKATARALLRVLTKSLSQPIGNEVHHSPVYDSELRRRAAIALGELKATAAIPALIRALDDGDAGVIRAATLALAKIGPKAAPATRQLLKLLQDKRPSFVSHRAAAASALGSIGPPARRGVGALTAALGEDNPQYRSLVVDLHAAAAAALGKLGAAARPAIPALVKAGAGGRRFKVRREAVEALRRLGPAGCAGLITALRSKKAAVRGFAAGALKGVCLDDPRVVLPLSRVLGDPDYRLRGPACEALAKRKSRAAAAIPALVAALHLGTGIDALEQIGPQAAPRVRRLLKSRSKRARRAAAVVLGSYGSAAAAATPDLLELMRDKDLHVRVAAVDALRQVGASGKKLEKRLTRCLRAGKPIISTACARALVALRAPPRRSGQSE